MIQQLIRERHKKTMRLLVEAANRLADPSERVIILVYDGPESAIRECSWAAPNQLPNDVRLVCSSTAAQIKDS